MSGKNALASWLAPPLFFAVAALVLCAFAWDGSPLNHDEITYLTMARHMVESGNWLDLDFHGAVVHQRPPLAIWLLAAIGRLGDFSLLFTRLPSIAMAWLTLLGLYLLMRELGAGASSTLIAPALLLSSALFYFNARRPMTDMTFLAGFSFFLYANVLAFRRPWAWLGAGLAAGWMLMSKGAITALPLTAVGLDLLLSPRRRELLSHRVWMGLGTALALAAPWHVAQSLRHGEAFWSEYLGFNVLRRASTSLFAEPDPLFYLRELADNELGTLLLAGVGLVGLVAGLWKDRRSILTSAVCPERFLLLAIACTAVPLQLASTRISHYFLPVLPGLFAAVTWAIGRWGDARRGRLVGVAGFGLAAALFLGNNLPHLANPDYSPDQARFARLVAADLAGSGNSHVAIVSVNHYDLAFFYFLDRSPEMLTDSERFFTIVDTEPLLHRSRAVRLIPRNALLSDLAAGPFYALTEPAHVPLFCGEDGARCGRTGPFRLIPGDYLALVTNRP